MRNAAQGVDWSVPSPREGWRGGWDRLVGPGATLAEQAGTLAAGGAGALGVASYAVLQQLPWTWWEYGIASLITLDVVGGVFANATPSAKRWYHRVGQGGRQHFGFLALHGVHIVLVASIFSQSVVMYSLVAYGYLLLAGIATLIVPIILQRSMGQLAASGAVFLSFWGLPEIPGWEWFLPTLTLKLVVGHATLEAPFIKRDASCRVRGE